MHFSLPTEKKHHSASLNVVKGGTQCINEFFEINEKILEVYNHLKIPTSDTIFALTLGRRMVEIPM